MPTKDLSLLLTVLAAEEASLKRIYQRRLTAIKSRYDADDLFSDVQLRAIRDWDSCSSTDEEGVRKWVRVIARNMTMTVLDIHIGRAKRSVRREVTGSPIADFNESVHLQECAAQDDEDAVDVEELLQLCLEAVERLPARQSHAIQRRYLDDVDYEALATEMDVSPGAARTLVSRGIIGCREQVGRYSGSSTEGIANDKTINPERAQKRAAMANCHGRR